MEELCVAASIENVDSVIAFLDERLERVDCPIKAQMQLDVAVEEIFGNICHYAYDSSGNVLIQVNITENLVEIVFIDEGKPFNPLEGSTEIDTEEIAKSDQIGGLGIVLVIKSMDEVTYEYKNNKNQLTIRKNI